MKLFIIVIISLSLISCMESTAQNSEWNELTEDESCIIVDKGPIDRYHEVLCDNCGAHLGHAFYDEGFTEKETRYCINSLSLQFVRVHK